MSTANLSSLFPTKQLVLASNNPGKLAEFTELFGQANLAVQVTPQGQLTIEDAIEDGLSFIENALIKARHASRISGLPAIADDSGLCVPILGGQPGIYSARFAQDEEGFGHNKDLANNQKLLRLLEPHRHSGEPIIGQFVCVLALVRHADDRPVGDRAGGVTLVDQGLPVGAVDVLGADRHLGQVGLDIVDVLKTD